MGEPVGEGPADSGVSRRSCLADLNEIRLARSPEKPIRGPNSPCKWACFLAQVGTEVGTVRARAAKVVGALWGVLGLTIALGVSQLV